MVTGRTRWWRFGAVMGLSVGASAGLVLMVANGAIAASFSVSGQEFKVSATKLEAHGFVQYGSVDKTPVPGSNPKQYAPVPVAVSAMKTAKLTDLCQSVFTPLGALGSVTLTISAGTGGPGREVTATNMVVDMTQLNGDADFTNMEIGGDASELNKGPSAKDLPDENAQHREGFFSQQADDVVINNLQQTARATSAGDFNLKGLKLSLVTGRHECF
jgi:hypothetical protein